jgi:hypothetical protein
VHVLALHACISQHAYVVLHTKVKQGARLASRLVDDEVVEGQVVRQDQILLQGHVHTEEVMRYTEEVMKYTEEVMRWDWGHCRGIVR